MTSVIDWGGLVLLMKDCVGLHITIARASVNERGRTVVGIFCSRKNDVLDIVWGHYVLDDSPLDGSRIILFRDVHLLSQIDADAAPDTDSSEVPASDEI